MNENFFGKYSVFCVFGSVVGCVVVPLIAQVLQHQSMECMILSAIVITLTATRLKKSGNDSHHSKMLMSREFERRKLTNKKHRAVNTNTNHSHHSNQNHNHSSSNQHNQQYDEGEEEYMQQLQQQQQQHSEHLRVAEMERRSEEKRLRKLKKREEKLRKKDEENKKLKEQKERHLLKEKRRKQQKEIIPSNTPPFHNTAIQNYEKYIRGEDSCNGIRRQNENSRTTNSAYTTNHSNYYGNRQRIRRFNTLPRIMSREQIPFSSHDHVPRKSSVTDALSINCSSSLSASCSSLSSISSSGSSSPPPTLTSPKPSTPPVAVWKTPTHASEPANSNPVCLQKNDFQIHKSQQKTTKFLGVGGNVKPSDLCQRQPVIKSYSNFRPTKSKAAYNFDSSSLFCSNHDGDQSHKKVVESEKNSSNVGQSARQQLSYAGKEYSLFGSHQFGSQFLKAPII